MKFVDKSLPQKPYFAAFGYNRMFTVQPYFMIIARSPLRITLGGGGTDMPSYYREHGGFLVAAAIDKYVYVTAMRPFNPGIYLKYSMLEHVDTSPYPTALA